MSKIVSIATAVPDHQYKQYELFEFADKVLSKDAEDSRKLKFLYNHSGIETRYSILPDFNSANSNSSLFPPTEGLEPFPGVERRMELFNAHAVPLSIEAITKCILNRIKPSDITHLITVSCTGVSAPGIELQIMDAMGLPGNLVRTGVNFMGCYAAVHALRLADAFCKNDPNANVLVVCTELCTLHFQKTRSIDNITASLLFGDGCAAMLIQNSSVQDKGIVLNSFFSEVSFKGKKEMAWEISSSGFLMTLTGYVPSLIKEDFKSLLEKAMAAAGQNPAEITHWCVHPGGKQILQAISSSLQLADGSLNYSYDILRDYGNMSSASIVFVLEKILAELREKPQRPSLIFGAAFGPGLTMETFTGTYA